MSKKSGLNLFEEPKLKIINKLKVLASGLLLGGLTAFVAYLLLFFGSNFLFIIGKAAKFDSETGPVGDTLGGTLGPLIAIIAAVLTFLAFWVQYDANQQQKKDLAKERFESKFFEMLRFHKENVDQIILHGYDIFRTTTSKTSGNGNIKTKETNQVVDTEIKGRKVFEETYHELVACYKICEHALSLENFVSKDRYLIKISYKLFYYGVDYSLIDSIDNEINNDKSYFKKCVMALKRARLEHIRTSGKVKYYKVPGASFAVKIPVNYKPFSGHFNIISHYYRHLYMMSKYVQNQSEDIVSFSEKKEFLRIVRSQLTPFEQLMLYYNYLSGIGANWENKRNHFFSKFCMIKNMPLNLTKFSILPEIEFEHLIEECNSQGFKMFKNH